MFYLGNGNCQYDQAEYITNGECLSRVCAGYKERLALIPKLLVSATGDEFFLLTDHSNWWDQMGGEKWLM